MKELTRFINLAYIRDGNNTHTGEALLIACLLHCKGEEVADKDDLLRIMKDKNVLKTKEKK